MIIIINKFEEFNVDMNKIRKLLFVDTCRIFNSRAILLQLYKNYC